MKCIRHHFATIIIDHSAVLSQSLIPGKIFSSIFNFFFTYYLLSYNILLSPLEIERLVPIMKNTTHSLDIMSARLKRVHKLSHVGIRGTEQMDGQDYSFFYNLWLVCESMEEWDKLVRKYKELNGYEI